MKPSNFSFLVDRGIMEFRSPENKPITLEEWKALVEDWETRRVQQDLVSRETGEVVSADGVKDGDLFVSTVWTGTSLGDEVRTFETMVFTHAPNEDRHFDSWDQFTAYYGTREEAEAGHQQVLQDVRDWVQSGGRE